MLLVAALDGSEDDQLYCLKHHPSGVRLLHSKLDASLVVDRTAVADGCTPATDVDLDLEISVDEADTSEDRLI